MGEEDEISFDNGQRVSKYNSAIAQLYRIDILWQKAHAYATAGDLARWNWILDRVWCELAADCNDDDAKKFNEFIVQIANSKYKKEILYHILLDKEIFIRKLQNKQGKGTAYQETIEEYMDD